MVRRTHIVSTRPPAPLVAAFSRSSISTVYSPKASFCSWARSRRSSATSSQSAGPPSQRCLGRGDCASRTVPPWPPSQLESAHVSGPCACRLGGSGPCGCFAETSDTLAAAHANRHSARNRVMWTRQRFAASVDGVTDHSLSMQSRTRRGAQRSTRSRTNHPQQGKRLPGSYPSSAVRGTAQHSTDLCSR